MRSHSQDRPREDSPADRVGERLRSYEAHCRRHGLRMTVQKRHILEVLLGMEGHPTVDRIFERVVAQLPGVSRTTVYRILDSFVEAGVARKVEHSGPAARFDSNLDRHHHLVCVECDRVIDLEDPSLDELPVAAAAETGFQVIDYSVYFRGLCAACREAGTGAAPP